MSLRSQPLPPAPGPPPLVPPPPLPNVSPPPLPSSPRPRPRASEVQWRSRPQSRETGDAVTWPTKPSLHTVSDTQLEDERPLPRNRRTSLSSLSFALYSKKERPPPSPEPPVPPLKSSSQRRKPLEVRATVGNSRGVQRRTSGVERRVSATRSSSLTPPSRNPATGTVRSPSDTPPISPISPTLNKKRSFFRRVADRLTRSRTHLRDEAQENGTQSPSPRLPEEPDSAPSHRSDGVELPGPLSPFSYSPGSTSLPSTPRSVRTRKAPPPSIKVPGSTLGPCTLVVNGEGQYLDPELRSPNRTPLPPSPAVSSTYATSLRTATTSSGFQSTSPLATPTTPTPQAAALLRVPRKASSASALSELSRHGAISNTIDDRPPLPSPHGLNFPLPPITQPASQLQGRASSDGFTLKFKDICSKTTMSVHAVADSQGLPELAESPNHVTSRHAGLSMSNNHALPEVFGDENAVTKNSSSGSGDSHIPGGCETWQSDPRPPRSSSFSDQDKQLLLRSTRIIPRDAHARADSHTLGNLLLNLQQSPSRGDRAGYGHARADSNTLPPPSSSKLLSEQIQDKEESQATEEVRLVNLKVSRWLAESPVASASSSPRQSVSFSISESSFGHATGSFNTWKSALEAAEIGDAPEVERLTLKPEERGRKEEAEEPIRIEEKLSTRRSHSLSGREQENAETAPIPSSPRSLKEKKSRSLRFLPTRNITPSPALPSQSISLTSPMSSACPQASDKP